MRITTGITLALLMSTAGCGGDYEDGGVLSPTGPSAVSSPATPKGGMSSSPMGTTNAQAHGGLATAQANNMQSAKPDTRTVDFSSVKWEWNAARTHLEPDSFPDARVRSGSNVWRRDNGTGLIRIFSDTDLSGMRFSTSGSSWPLSMRRAGLYVSNISGADVERIRAGGGTGGRIDEPTIDEPTIDEPTIDEPTIDEPTAITCWASEAGKEVTVDAVGASIETPVEVTCDRSIDLPDDEAVVKTAAAPSVSPNWIDLTDNRYALRVPAGRSVYVDVILYPDDNGTSARVGNVVWPTVPPGEMSSLSALVVHQPGRTVGSDNPPIILICLDPSSFSPKRPGPCPDRVGVGTTVSLRAIVTPPPSGYVTEEVNGRLNGKIECGVGQEARTCGWRISQVDGSGTPGRFESGDSVNLTWRAPSSPGSVTIGGRYQLYVQGVGGFFPVPEHWSDNKGDAAGSNTLTFDVIEPTSTSPPDLRPHLSCDNGPMDSEIDKNGTSCDSIDGADVAVTLTVTRPNGTTVSSLLYYVEWDVRGGGPPVISSSHPTPTTSRARHRLTWSSTGLTTGGQGVVVAAARPNGYNYAFNSTQVLIIVKGRDLPPVVSEIACTPRVTPQGDNPAVCTATLDAPGGQGHLVDLSIDASDPNDDPLTYIWRAANGRFNGGVRTNRTTWSAAGLSTGQYTVTANVAERLTGVHERTVVVNVARYAPPMQEPPGQEPPGQEPPGQEPPGQEPPGQEPPGQEPPGQEPPGQEPPDMLPYVCTPDGGWENGTLAPMIGDAYCGQLHDRGYTWTGFTDGLDFRYYRAVGSSGEPEIEVQAVPAFLGIGLRKDHNRICGVSRGVCGEADSLYDSTVHSDGGNVYQWVNVYPINP